MGLWKKYRYSLYLAYCSHYRQWFTIWYSFKCCTSCTMCQIFKRIVAKCTKMIPSEIFKIQPTKIKNSHFFVCVYVSVCVLVCLCMCMYAIMTLIFKVKNVKCEVFKTVRASAKKCKRMTLLDADIRYRVAQFRILNNYTQSVTLT